MLIQCLFCWALQTKQPGMQSMTGFALCAHAVVPWLYPGA
jgi:hypothetical protein